ncbi:hypothetical protein GCM10010168_48100 [Actinoplanes ianthinogenes]|uniref:PH domain-containing protein n=1 Tax=Actinoplanes ianthinogenes TaxID=122358 RepID=A0ABM7LNV8_9ACTN|nr:hypothetical protein [Actinoplanes ianthinogenes]BCJ40890.1 hypothetical protein Aiant_15470 [Actinoplanes ianthinogenes]GGR24449.1 hypothetical protein GCM10010168_48100 [Actinoplanes ianthinogenes]
MSDDDARGWTLAIRAGLRRVGWGRGCRRGGTVSVEVVNGSVEIFGDPAGLRDLARMCLALSDAQASEGAHIHLDAGINPLDSGSASLMLARDPRRPA